MTSRLIKWTAVLLCLLVITQEFSVFALHGLTYQSDFVYGFSARNTSDVRRREEVAGKRQKRVVAAVLFGASIVAMLANIGFDIYLKIEGCCGLFDNLCDYKEEFKSLKKGLQKSVDRMNDKYTAAENVLEYVTGTNRLNGDIWYEVYRIMKLQERIIQRLDPKVIVSLNNKSTEISKSLREHNTTVLRWSDAEVLAEYSGMFDSGKTAMIGFAPIISVLAITGIVKGYRYYKGLQAIKAVQNSATAMQNLNHLKVQKVMGVKNVQTFTKASVNAQSKAASTATKGARFARFASGAVSVIAIGMEVWSAIKKVEACRDIRDNTKKAVESLRPEKPKFEKTESELEQFNNDVNKIYSEIKGQLTAEKFLNYILILQDISGSAHEGPEYLKKSAIDIGIFHKKITTADRDETLQLQRLLVNALKNVTYSWECYLSQTNTVVYVYDKCKIGSGTITHIYNYALGLFEADQSDCTLATGHRFTTYDATVKYVGERLLREGYNDDCVLNNHELFRITCLKDLEGYAAKDVVDTTGLTHAQYTHFINRCLPGKVSPKVENEICALKRSQTLEELKKTFKKYNQTDVVIAFNKCPKPRIENFAKKMICHDKIKNNYSLQQVLGAYAQYNRDDVITAYNACVLPAIESGETQTICFMKTRGVLISQVYTSFAMFSRDSLLQAWNNC